MRGKELKTLHHFFYFIQNVVELTVHYVLYLSPGLDKSPDNYLKFNNILDVSRSLKESERFLPFGPISLDRSIIIFCRTNSTVFPFRSQNPP
jgi:hypothetical protein